MPSNVVTAARHRRIRGLRPRAVFYRHLARNAARAGGLIAACLALGVAGYHYIAHLRWIDALLNASMILSAMGPVDPLCTTAAKLFAAAYALFSGVAFITIVGVLFAPVVHRFLHKFHLELAEEDDAASGPSV
jgi:hypothetical protein